MNANERATEFVKRYPNLFTEDNDFWIAALEIEFITAERDAVRQEQKNPTQVIASGIQKYRTFSLDDCGVF